MPYLLHRWSACRSWGGRSSNISGYLEKKETNHMTKSALIFLKKQCTLEYRRFRKKLLLLDS